MVACSARMDTYTRTLLIRMVNQQSYPNTSSSRWHKLRQKVGDGENISLHRLLSFLRFLSTVLLVSPQCYSCRKDAPHIRTTRYLPLEATNIRRLGIRQCPSPGLLASLWVSGGSGMVKRLETILRRFVLELPDDALRKQVRGRRTSKGTQYCNAKKNL